MGGGATGDKGQRRVESRTRTHRQPGTGVYNCSGVSLFRGGNFRMGLRRVQGEKKKSQNISKIDSRSFVCVCFGLILPAGDHRCCHQNLMRRDKEKPVSSTVRLCFPNDLRPPLRNLLAVSLVSVGIYSFDTVFSSVFCSYRQTISRFPSRFDYSCAGSHARHY